MFTGKLGALRVIYPCAAPCYANKKRVSIVDIAYKVTV